MLRAIALDELVLRHHRRASWSEHVCRAWALPRLCGGPDRGVCSTETGITGLPLHGLEEEPIMERFGVEVAKFPIVIAVVKQAVLLQLVQRRVIQRPPRRKVVVVIIRH